MAISKQKSSPAAYGCSFFRGVGRTTGAKYQANGGRNVTTNTNKGRSLTNIFTSVLVAQGNVPNFTRQNIIHCTVNENGEIIISHRGSKNYCRG